MAAKKKAKVVGVRFILTGGRTREFTADEHEDWETTSAEFEATNGKEGHNQIVRKEDITSGTEVDESESAE